MNNPTVVYYTWCCVFISPADTTETPYNKIFLDISRGLIQCGDVQPILEIIAKYYEHSNLVGN